jgi:hypothetical protein
MFDLLKDPVIRRRFWAKVLRTNGCWLWTGAATPYGKFTAGRLADGTRQTILAHRFSYEIEFGPIPEGLFLLHSCDTPPCVRPQHLSPGTHAENMEDMASKLRHGRSTLTVPQVREIRAFLKDGMPVRVIGSRFGVSPSLIHRIAHNEIWRHVDV